MHMPPARKAGVATDANAVDIGEAGQYEALGDMVGADVQEHVRGFALGRRFFVSIRLCMLIGLCVQSSTLSTSVS